MEHKCDYAVDCIAVSIIRGNNDVAMQDRMVDEYQGRCTAARRDMESCAEVVAKTGHRFLPIT